MPLIPHWLLRGERNKMIKMIKKNVIVRRFSTKYTEEFNSTTPHMDFAATAYPWKDITIKIHFAAGQNLDKLTFRRIRANGVVSVPIETEFDKGVVVDIDKLQNETLRITWSPKTPASMLSTAATPHASMLHSSS
jgi:hypothetical protein